jgi:hypothetical protein
MTERAVGEDGLALRQGGKGLAQVMIGVKPGGDIDVVDIKQVVLGVDSMMADQSLQGDPVQAPVFAPQGIDLRRRYADNLGHVAVDAHIDQAENLFVSRIQGVVEIEDQNVHS